MRAGQGVRNKWGVLLPLRSMNRLITLLRREICLSVVYEVDTTDAAGDWRLWSDGFTTRERAEDHMRDCMRKRQQWSGAMKPEAVRWRVARKIVLTKYFDAR